jgi:hypothetical protein
MTPKEKAKELVDKMEKDFQYFASREIAIKHALIAVDEMIRFEKASINLMNDFMKVVNLGFDRKGFYYEDVKKEIEKL